MQPAPQRPARTTAEGSAVLNGRSLAGDERNHEAGPCGEDDVGGDDVEFLEEAGASPDSLAGLFPEGFQAVTCGMEGEGQQVHGREHPGQVFVSMPEVVRQVVAVVFQHVEALVFDLPTGPRAGCDLNHVVPGKRQTGYKSAIVSGLSLGIEDADPKPVDVHRILAVAQRNSLDPTVAIGQSAASGPALGHGALVQRRSLDILIQLSLIHISEPTRQAEISYAVFCLKKKK